MKGNIIIMYGTKKVIVSIDSSHASKYTSSGDFVYTLHTPIENVKWIKLLSGTYPQTSERTLYMNIQDFVSRQVRAPNNRDYNFILRFDGSSGRTIFNDLDNSSYLLKQENSRLNQLDVKIYNKDGDIVSFGLDTASIRYITPGNPTIIRTWVNHGLVDDDLVMLKNLDNMSNTNIKKGLEDRTWVVDVTAADTFQIDFDTTGEGASQPYMGSDPAYTLGLNSVINLETLYHSIDPKTYATHVDGTNIETETVHGLSVGQRIKISGFDNGATSLDNSLINNWHEVITVVDSTHFTIGVALSSYATPSFKTGIQTFLLGSHGNVVIDKMQCSFDFMFISEDDYKNSILNK